MNPYKNLFLQQSYNDSTDLYYDILRDTEDLISGYSRRIPVWDYVILSASNPDQAKAFNEQIRQRLKEGRLPRTTHYAVIPDPDGKRVGSGGATLNVLRYIKAHDNRQLNSLRTLLIHSGGDAKRTPQYSACGKIFSPVPRMLPDGHRSTLFDEFMIAMCGIPGRISSGLLTCSGDVELLFNPLQLDFYGEGAAAFSIKEPAVIGKNHGVFLGDDNGYVRKFLHKQTVDSLQKNGAVDDHGLVNIDTGAVLFSGSMVEDLYQLVDTNEKYHALVNDHVRLSFYADFLYPLAVDSTIDSYMEEVPEGDFSPELTQARHLIWDALRKYRLKLVKFSPASFLHFGTTHEVLDLVTKNIEDYRYLGWKKVVNSNYKGDRFAASNAYISPRAHIDESSYIEDSYIHHDVRIGKGCVISGVTLGRGFGDSLAENRKFTGDERVIHATGCDDDNGQINIPDDTVMHGLKLADGRFVVRVYGVQDNPKECKWFGQALDESLWTKRLFPVADSIHEAVEKSLRLLEYPGLTNKYNDELISLKDSFNQADVTQILPWQEKLNDKIKVESLLEAIDNGMPAEKAASIFRTGISKRVEDWLLNIANETSFSRKIRIYYYLSKIVLLAGKSSLDSMESNSVIPDLETQSYLTIKLADELWKRCFDTIRDGVLDAALEETGYREDLKICIDEVITRLPVRVNWGGGWSDTPPYCLEHGGTVLNAAIKLNGGYPIEVTVRKVNRPVIILESTDIGSYGEFTDIRQLQDCQNPSDPFALHKAALIACGVIPYQDSNVTIDEICARIGGGIYINTRVINIPKGSGLGTSSILAGACVKGLFDFFGIPSDIPTSGVNVDEPVTSGYKANIYDTVLCMEQIMSTGGGWQDQVGGLAPGIKLVTADEGLAQKIICTPLRVKQGTLDELNERFALIYTGQRRLARNLLRDIVGRYVGNDPDVVDTLYKIQQVAVLMKLELEKGHVDGFAELLNQHWELSKKLDQGCTNTCIDQLFLSIEDLIDGKMICGAGGGGFIQVILKKGVTKEVLQERLDEVFGESGVGVWDCEIMGN